MKKGMLLFVLLAAIVYLAPSASAEDPAGKKVFLDQKCDMCHSVESAAIAKKPTTKSDLSNIGSTRNADWLTKYLKKEEAIEGKKHMKAFTGKDEDFTALVKWLEGLKK